MAIPINEKYLAFINTTESFKWFYLENKTKNHIECSIIILCLVEYIDKIYVSLKIVIISLLYITSQYITI